MQTLLNYIQFKFIDLMESKVVSIMTPHQTNKQFVSECKNINVPRVSISEVFLR